MTKSMWRTMGVQAAALALVACGGNTKHQSFTAEDGSKVDVTTRKDGDHVVMTGKSSDGTEMRVEVNGAWPKELVDAGLVYPGAKLMSVMGGGTRAGQTLAVIQTADSAPKVLDFYKSRAKAAGMEVESTMEMGVASIFSAANKQAKTRLTIHVQPEKEATKAIVTYEAGVD